MVAQTQRLVVEIRSFGGGSDSETCGSDPEFDGGSDSETCGRDPEFGGGSDSETCERDPEFGGGSEDCDRVLGIGGGTQACDRAFKASTDWKGGGKPEGVSIVLFHCFLLLATGSSSHSSGLFTVLSGL